MNSRGSLTPRSLYDNARACLRAGALPLRLPCAAAFFLTKHKKNRLALLKHGQDARATKIGDGPLLIGGIFMGRRFLVTAALPYSNGRLHVGHIAGAYLPADTYVRYLRARGDDVRFICGSDDNGVASLISARKEGQPSRSSPPIYNARQAADFAGLGIQFDIYGGTHQPGFVETAQPHQPGLLPGASTTRATSSRRHQAALRRPGRAVPARPLREGQVLSSAPTAGLRLPEAYGDQCEACGNLIDPMKLINPVSTITGTRPEPRETTHWYMQAA